MRKVLLCYLVAAVVMSANIDAKAQGYPTALAFGQTGIALPFPCNQGGNAQFGLKELDSAKPFYTVPTGQQLTLTDIHGYIQLPPSAAAQGVILDIFSAKPAPTQTENLRFNIYAYAQPNGVVPFSVAMIGGVVIPAGQMICPSLIFAGPNGIGGEGTAPTDLIDRAKLYFSGFLATPPNPAP